MDIRNYIWVYTFEPSTPSNTAYNQLTTMKIIIAALSGIVGTVILMTIGVLGYRWYRRNQKGKQDEVLRVYGNHGNTY